MNAKPQRYAIVGAKHRGAEDLVYNILHGAPLMLVREAGNRFDANAVQVWAKDAEERWKHVGYVPKSQNAVLARFIDDAGQSWHPPIAVGTFDAASAAADSVTVSKAVGARVHRGNSPVPLVEVV